MSNEQYIIRKKELATLLLMANIVSKLGSELTKKVNQFRKKLRKHINHIEKNEKELYTEAHALATRAWGEANDKREENLANLSVASTLDCLNLLVEEVKWINKKVYTQKQFIEIYASIVEDKAVALTYEVENASKLFINDIAEALGYDKPTENKLKRLIWNLKQNKILEQK